LFTSRSIGPSFALDRRHHRLDVLRPAHVRGDRKAVDLLGGRLDLICASRRHRDPHSGVGELEGDQPADSAAAARDEGNLAFELARGVHPAEDRDPKIHAERVDLDAPCSTC